MTDDPLDKIITAYFIAVTYINEYGGSGKSDKQGEEAYKEARDEAKLALLALINKAVIEARIDELEKIDQAYSWKSIVTYDGFSKWKDNRISALKETT